MLQIGQKTSSSSYKPAVKAQPSPVTPTRPQPPIGSSSAQSSTSRDTVAPSARHGSSSLTASSTSAQPSSPGISKSSQRSPAVLPPQHGVPSAAAGRKRPSLSNDPNGLVATARYVTLMQYHSFKVSRSLGFSR
jgi:hypothetical protein